MAIGVGLYLVALAITPLVFVILELRFISDYLSGHFSQIPLLDSLRSSRNDTESAGPDEGGS